MALSSEIGRLTATLAGWSGARIGQDSVWMKPPGAKEVALHQDGTYISVYVQPAETITCWIALDNVTVDMGPIEYVPGSHRWGLKPQQGEFHAPNADYRTAMYAAAQAARVSQPEIVPIELAAGSCVIHHGNTWHGSGKNYRRDRSRLSLAVHTLSAESKFQTHAGYICGRYKRIGDNTMDESFFPILWTAEGYRSPHLAEYCEDALATSKHREAASVQR